MNKYDRNGVTRREALRSASALAGATLLASWAGSANSYAQSNEKPSSASGTQSNEEYVWLSANANLPLFVAHDHQALNGKKGKVALLGLIEQTIDQQAFSGFRSVAAKAGLTCLDPQEDKGNQAEAARVAAAIIQANPDLVGMAGFDSESGPGFGQAIKEADLAGKLVATCVDAEPQHLRLVKEGVLTAAIGQKRELFTYQGVKSLYELRHSTLKFTKDDKAAGVVGIPINYNTGTYTVTKDNVDLFIKT